MATVAGSGSWISRGVHKKTWTGLANGDVGSALSAPHLTVKTIQVSGTFGTGGSVSIEGSNDGGTTWTILDDTSGAAVTLTAAGMKQIGADPELIRPHVTAGDGTTDLNVEIVSAVQGF